LGAGKGTPPTEGGERTGRKGSEREADGAEGEFGLGFYEFGESFVLGPRRFLFGSCVLLACGCCDAVAHGVR